MKSRKINNLLNIKSRKNKIKNNSTRRENFNNNNNKTLKNKQEKNEEENKPILKYLLQTQSGLGDKLMDLWASATISTLIKHKLYVKIKHLNRLQTTEKISKDMQHNYNFNNIKIPNTKFILNDYDKSYELFSKYKTLIDDNLHISHERSYSRNTPYFIHEDRDKYYNSKLKYNLNNYSYNEIIDTFKYIAYNTKLLLKNDDIKLNIYKDYIGIHIRATDKIVKNPPPWEMTIEYFNQLIILSTNYCKTLINHKNYNYVICSDDKKIASNFKNNLLEFNNNSNIIISDNTPEIDMTILSKTKEIIQVSRYSNFALCASLLGNNKVKFFYDKMNDYKNAFYIHKWNHLFEDNITILSVATDNNQYLKNFEYSIFKIGMRPHILGINQKWNGFLGKIIWLRNYLINHIIPFQPVCYCDAYDVLFVKPLPPVIPNKIIISGESEGLGGGITAPIHNLWKLLGESHNKYINAGFVYGYSQDIIEMLEWCIEKEKTIKYTGYKGVIYDKSVNMKSHYNGEWIPMMEGEYESIPKNDMVHGLDQVLLCMWANEFPKKVYLDINEDYVTSIMENENFNISTLTTNYGKPSVIHVPFMNRRLDFYNKIKDRIINYETLYNLFDIVIPVGPNDEYIIEKQIKFTKKNIIGYRNIYLICYKPSINISGCITIDENIFPFNKETVIKYHGKSEKYHPRNGWYLQQLLKLYAGKIIPDILDKYLVVDSDTFFLKPTTFVENNKCLYNYGTEYHKPYFEHMKKLDPELIKMNQNMSGICHHMMFETKYIEKLIYKIEINHNDLFYNIFLKFVTEEALSKRLSGASEYEIYFNYMLKYYPDKIQIRKLNWKNICKLETDVNLDYISYHWYMRKEN